MKIDKTITRWSGAVATFVRTTIAQIPFNDRVKFAYVCEYGGLSDRAALDALSLTHFPTLDADAMRDYGQYRPKDPDKIWISDRLCREYRLSGDRNNYSHTAFNQICRHRGQPINLLLRPAVFDRYVLADDIAGLL